MRRTPMLLTVLATFALSASACVGGGEPTRTVSTPSVVPASPVEAPVVAQITVTPSSADALLGSQTPLTAIVVDVAGRPVTGSRLTWTSSDPNKVSVSSAGIMTAAAEGVATVTAAMSGKSGEATIRVVSGSSDTAPAENVVITPASPVVETGATLKLSAEVRTASGSVIVGRAIAWSSSNTSIATVDASGLVTGRVPGVAGIQATNGGKSATVSLAVVRPRVSTVSVSPGTSQLKAGGTVYLSAVPKDANGQPLSERPVAWSSSNLAVAVVNASGNATAVGGGTATITAILDGVTGTADIAVSGPPATVAPAPVATVTVSPQSPAIVVGQTVQLNAVAKDAAGNVLTGQTISWSASNAGVATISGSGLVTAIAAGASSMTATAGGKSGSTLVAVSSVAAPPPPPPPPTGPPAPGLFNDYSATAPHYRHISMMVTEWRISGEPNLRAGEYDWVLGHYDHLMGARPADVKSRMPSVTNIQYAVYLSVIQPNTGEPDQIASVYYNDMARWYASHSQYNMETAFLHKPGGSITAADRLLGEIWGSKRWFINVGDAGARAYHADRLARVASQTPGFPDDGVFIDEHDGGNIGRMLPSAEYADYNALQPAIVGMLQAIRAGLAGRTLQINTSESTSPNSIAQIGAAGATHLEQMNNPMREMIPRWDDIEKILAVGASVQFVTALTDNDYDTQIAGWTAGNETSPAKRGRMFELASYYMVLTSPSKLWLTTYNGQWGTVTYGANWIKAIEANVGTAQGPRAMYKSGTDGIGRPYQIWSRAFDRALVLTRPQFSWAYTQYDDATAVTVNLPGGETWHVLHSDGTVSAAATSVTLRNAEAVILVKGSSL